MFVARPALTLVRQSLSQLLVVPFPVFMLLLALFLGLAAGLSERELVKIISAGFGQSLGEIALILLPSFVFASALTSSSATANMGGVAAMVAPFAGAAMVCPDTAYAALSPMSAGRRLSVLFGVYAGFKLLVPAGPAIIAASLGGLTPALIAWGAVAFLFAWGAGIFYAKLYERNAVPPAGRRTIPLAISLPFAALLMLIFAGALLSFGGLSLPPVLQFLFSPKGALLVAAGLSLCFIDGPNIAKAFESSVRRTAPLLLMIGAASALGAMIVQVFSFEALAKILVSTGLTLPALFILTAAFKVAKGSSMATFAGTSGIVSAMLPSLGVSAEAAALAMCAGAFVTIAPNDSLYWLVKADVLEAQANTSVTRILGGGALVQGLTAFAIIQLAHWIGWLP